MTTSDSTVGGGSATPTPQRDWLRERYVDDLTARLDAADIGVWRAPSSRTGLTVVGLAADVAMEMVESLRQDAL